MSLSSGIAQVSSMWFVRGPNYTPSGEAGTRCSRNCISRDDGGTRGSASPVLLSFCRV